MGARRSAAHMAAGAGEPRLGRGVRGGGPGRGSRQRSAGGVRHRFALLHVLLCPLPAGSRLVLRLRDCGRQG